MFANIHFDTVLKVCTKGGGGGGGMQWALIFIFVIIIWI